MKWISAELSADNFVALVNLNILKSVDEMRTSQSQFELMVDFMERNGDLSKSTSGPQGKILNLSMWDSLRDLLNQDPVGETKSTEKWRKTWSDLKNNCKRKAARIHHAATGTGGAPASTLQLTPLESRVMQIIGMQAATGIPSIPEIGLDEAQQDHTHNEDEYAASSLPRGHNTSTAGNFEDHGDIQVLVESLRSSEEVRLREEISTRMDSNVIVESTEFQPAGPSGLQGANLSEVLQANCSRPVSQGSEHPSSASREQARRNAPLRTPLRHRGVRRQLIASPTHRRFRETQADRVAAQFLRCDEEWRQFRIEQDRENRRLRSRELDLQERWQDITIKFLDLAARLLNRYLNE